MELADINESVKKIITEIGAKNGNGTQVQITDDDSLIDSGLIDSLDFIQLLEVFSETFGVLIFPSELSLDNFDSINKISLFVHLKLNGEDV